jgi:tetratricopeptide (TPR) repeat protein
MTSRAARLLLVLLLSLCFSLAAWLQPRSLAWRGRRAQADTMFQVLLGDGRRMFANHFFTKADVYFHSGYYPSIFDQAKPHYEGHVTAEAHERDPATAAALNDLDFLGRPKDWLDGFTRRFRITEHTHLEGGGTERELLPWLKLSAELDPQQVETYTTAAYWLRNKLGKVDEAREFLRDGLRANPDSHEILFELGRLYADNLHDEGHARNLWELALGKWQKNESGQAEPDRVTLARILTSLARLEEREGNFAKAVEYSVRLKTVSPHPEVIESQIKELEAMQARRDAAPPAAPRR